MDKGEKRAIALRFFFPSLLKKTKGAFEIFRRLIDEKLSEKLDDQFDLRTSQTASMAMQCFAKIGEFISLANSFSRSGVGAGIGGWFGRLNGKLGVSSSHRITLNSHDIARVFTKCARCHDY